MGERWQPGDTGLSYRKEWGSEVDVKGRKSNNGKPRRKDAIDFFRLRLYVAGHTPKSEAALENLRTICEQHLSNHYQLEVIDLQKNPQLASGDQILAIPTLVRRLPPPIKKIVGDLSQTERVLVGLDLQIQRK